MSNHQKQIKETPETESKKSSKIFLLVFLVAVTALAAIYFFMNDNEKVVEREPVEIIEEENLEIMDTIEVVEEDTTMLEVDMEEVVEKIQDKPVTSPKKKRIDYNNSAKYWKTLFVNNQDTSYFIIKNSATGLKLSNRYYSKEVAEKELENFKKIFQ